MAKVKIQVDPSVNSLIVWFDDPQKMAYLSPIEESRQDLSLIKTEDGEVIGIEVYFHGDVPGTLQVALDTLPYVSVDALLGRDPEVTTP